MSERVEKRNAEAAGARPPLARLPIGVALVVLVPIACAWPVRLLLQSSEPGLYRAEPLLAFAVIAVLDYLVIWFGWRALRKRAVTLDMLGFRPAKPGAFGLAVLGALVGIGAIYPLARMLVETIGLAPPQLVPIGRADPVDIASAVLLLGLIIPFAEEVLFRGFLLGLLRERLRSLLLIGVIGAIAFALPHLPRMGVGGALFILAWSAVPVSLFLYTRSLFVSMMAHALNNLFAYVAVPLLLLPDPAAATAAAHV